MDVDWAMLDVETTSCYFGDSLCHGGGCHSCSQMMCGLSMVVFSKFDITWRHIYFKEPVSACIIQTNDMEKYIGSGVALSYDTNATYTQSCFRA